MNPDRARWNEKHRKGGHDRPSVALIMHQGRLTRGRALDLAGGTGENAAILALAGWRVTLLDVSDEALVRARRRAADLRADVALVQGDALRLPLRGPFDTVVVTRYLERSIAAEIAALLAPGGTLFCEQPMRGIDARYCAQPGEFGRLFAGLETMLQSEDGETALYIGRRPR